MGIELIILLVVLFIAALAGTLYAFKQEENKMKKYEEAGDTVEDQLRRSHEYESSSLKSNIPLQLVIYGVTITLSLVIFAFYVF
ncbi:hypothetical protein SAMN04488072_102343 [Lentibacillus halodurans]|uniref:Uncharacterized protein n=1 Tax=Lentibacillus halodurans TaxID=237679 RepID=A0A1I0WA75_9BACI|nr:hypothetical protein [Lentibacillus halodurans]SFA85622.1 hypothetical protein SAMN04488072_102343 [Lentibacillus halodurans]